MAALATAAVVLGALGLGGGDSSGGSSTTSIIKWVGLGLIVIVVGGVVLYLIFHEDDVDNPDATAKYDGSASKAISFTDILFDTLLLGVGGYLLYEFVFK